MRRVRSLWVAVRTAVLALGGRWSTGRAPPTADALGRRGERVAERALVRAGYRIVARRLRTQGGEIDLVALDGETLVLVEVKASAVMGGLDSRTPIDRVDRAKRKRLESAARTLRGHAWEDRPRRVDVVCVVFTAHDVVTTIVRGAVVLAQRESRS